MKLVGFLMVIFGFVAAALATVVDGLKSIQIIEECYKNTSKINRKT